MLTLYKYELKKILSQKYFQLASIIMCLFILAVGITPVFTGGVPTKEEKEIVSNRYIDDSLITEAIRNKGRGLYEYVFDFIKYSTRSTEVENFSSKEVYEKRLETIEKVKQESFLSDEEYAYWNDKQQEIKTPFKFNPATGYRETLELIYMLSFVTIVLCNIGVSGIFADEKYTGADQIIFSSKYGKTKLFTTKILVALTLGLIIPIVLFISLLTVELIVFGSDGYNTQLQAHIPTSLYNITLGDAMCLCFSKLFFNGILCSMFAAFLSELTMKHQAAQAISIVVMFISMVSIPERLGIISYIWHFLPATNIGAWMFEELRMINLFGVMLNDFIATPIIWILVSLAFIVITKIKFKKYEVLGR